MELELGTLTTNITVADSDAGSRVSKQKVTVNIVVQGRPQITLSASNMNFSQDNVITESSQLLDISNTGSKTLNWVTESSASWLSVDIPNGTLDPGKDLLIDVHCNSSSLVPGTYTATFVVRDNDSGTAVTMQKLTVTLVVS